MAVGRGERLISNLTILNLISTLLVVHEMHEDLGMVGFRKVAFISSGIETLLSSCNLIQTGIFVELNRTPLLIAAKC